VWYLEEEVCGSYVQSGGYVEILQHKHEILNQKRQLIEKNAQIQAQRARLAQFISKKECMDFFAGTHPDFEE
jgi:hypothetical protein